LVAPKEVYGTLEVIEKVGYHTFPSGQRKILWLCKCDCGKEVQVLTSNLTSGNTKNCGCSRGTHGDSRSRLYHCWDDMKRRARRRCLEGDICNVHSDWLDYLKFKEWSMSNGYTKHLVLCRNGDKGDYEPTNARWDTKGNNASEYFSKNYLITYKDKTKEVINNLRAFSREHEYHSSSLIATAKGTYKSKKGYKGIKASEIITLFDFD